MPAARLQQALDALRQKRQPMTAQQLEAACGFSAQPDSLLAAALAASDRVEVSSAGDYTYKACASCFGFWGLGLGWKGTKNVAGFHGPRTWPCRVFQTHLERGQPLASKKQEQREGSAAPWS